MFSIAYMTQWGQKKSIILLPLYINKNLLLIQGATKWLSDSPGLVKWAVGLATFNHKLQDGQASEAMLATFC